MCAKSLPSCPTVCNPMDCSPSDFSVHGILQASIPEWIAMPSSRRHSWPKGLRRCLLRLLHWQVCSLSLVPPGKPRIMYNKAKSISVCNGGQFKASHKNSWSRKRCPLLPVLFNITLQILTVITVINCSFYKKWGT